MHSTVPERIKRILVLSIFLFTVPLLGWLTSLYVESSLESQFRKVVIGDTITESDYLSRGLSYLKVCGRGGPLRDEPQFTAICAFAEEVEDTRLASAITAALGGGLLALIVGARVFAGSNRKRLSLVFSPLVRVVMLILAVSLIAQAGLFIYSIYTLEVAAIQRVHAGLLLGIGLAAAFGSYQLVRGAFGLFRTKPLRLRGERLSREGNANIYGLVDEIGKKLGAEAPDQIVVGLEPNFFVTSADVDLMGADAPSLNGRTLFLSTALMRILSQAELAAVIGHELGHFRGQDTEYSLRFAPIYSRMTTALGELSASKDSTAQMATLPAVATLGVCLTEFAEAERTVGRERELLADRAGAEATSASLLATALVKVSLFSDAWSWLSKKNIDTLTEGRYFENLSSTYRGVCDSLFESLKWQEAKASLLQFVQPHPIDTHPPLGQRLEALGVQVDEIDAESVRPSDDAAISLLNNAEAVEQSLTTLEARWLVAISAVAIPDAAPD